ARIHDRLLKVGQATGLLGPGRLAAGQSSKLVEVDRLRPPRLQVGVEEGRVAYLVVGVVGDVLRHVAVKVLQRSNVGLVSAVYTSELVVLLPEIGLDELRRGEKAQNRGVALRKCAARRHGVRRQQRAGWNRGRCHPGTD